MTEAGDCAAKKEQIHLFELETEGQRNRGRGGWKENKCESEGKELVRGTR